MPRENYTEELGALVDTEDATRIIFDINPESFEDEKSNEIAEVSIPGMSHPRPQFSNGGTRTVSFTLYLHYGATDNIPTALKLLRSWLYPEYEGGKMIEAPVKLLLIFGDNWPDEKWLLRSCNITRQRFDKELNCTFAEVQIELIEFVEQSIGKGDIRG